MGLISYLTTVRFGFGESQTIDGDLLSLGVTRPLIIADQGVVAAGIVAALVRPSPILASAPVFDQTPPNPTEAAVLQALTRYRAGQCDGIVAVGGGSPIDLAKGVALLASHQGSLESFAAILGGIDRITASVAPVIAVPTTAGTGSEVGRAALITLDDGRKLGFISPHLIPKLAVCDPGLTMGLPPMLTAATGMDAITHCLETFLSPRDNPPAEAIALDGLRRAMSFIKRAVLDGSDREARSGMMMAALEGGLTFQKGLGAVHALSHPLGGLKSVSLHHGTLNAVLLPAVLRFNAADCRAKFAEIRRTLDLPEETDIAEYMAALSRELGLPGSLSEMNVPENVLDMVAEAAVKDHSSATNPRATTVTDYRALLQSSYS